MANFTVSEKEQQQINRDLVEWLKNILEDEDYGTLVYNIVLGIKQFVERSKKLQDD